MLGKSYLSTNITSCKYECSRLKGHLPYAIEGPWSKKSKIFQTRKKLTLILVHPIVDEIYINNTINRSKIPSFETFYRREKINERDVVFFLNSQYDFKKQVWKSGFFKIQEKDWAVSDTAEYKYPILDDGSYFGIFIHMLHMICNIWYASYLG